MQHSIQTIDDSPICSRQYGFPPVHKEESTKQVDESLKNKIIKPSQSPYNNPVWIIPEKPDSKGNIKWRMVLDFRKRIEKAIGDSYPLPNINDILDSLGSARYFSVFDLLTDFHHIKMGPEDSNKPAPLNQLLKKDTPFIWTDKQQIAFDILKSRLCEEQLLQRPDFSEPFVLTTDASGDAIGDIF